MKSRTTGNYPARFTSDFPDRGLDRCRRFCDSYAIPIAIVLSLVGALEFSATSGESGAYPPFRLAS